MAIILGCPFAGFTAECPEVEDKVEQSVRGRRMERSA
jgi:hypothetical protein